MGKIFEGVLKLFEREDAPRPQEVADAVHTLIQTPTGQRPLRLIADRFMSDGVRAINELRTVKKAAVS